MKKPLLLFFIILSLFVKAQNLVPNPSFEDTVNCPYAAGDIDKATGWTSLCGSPDLFNICNQYDWGVPTNIFGYQIPASGNAYAGFASYSNSSPNTREYPACNLVSPLTIGVKYFISFKVALSLNTLGAQTNCASNKLGASFATNPYICNSLITNNPPVYTDSIITDSVNWTRVSGSFVADSAYTYLAVGNFFDDTNTDTIYFFSDFSDNAYYYLDDICVSTDSLYANNYTYTGVTENSSIGNILCYPNPFVDNITIQNLSQKKMDVEIYNVLGELLYSAQNVVNRTLIVNINNAYTGMLFVKIKTGNQTNTYKLLKL